MYIGPRRIEIRLGWQLRGPDVTLDGGRSQDWGLQGFVKRREAKPLWSQFDERLMTLTAGIMTFEIRFEDCCLFDFLFPID